MLGELRVGAGSSEPLRLVGDSPRPSLRCAPVSEPG